MSRQPEQHNGIVIVGGGPVGLALTLARYGVRSLIVEKREKPTSRDQSRAITWMPRGLEFANWLGILPHLLQRGVLRTTHQFWGKHLLLQIPFEEADSPYAFTLQLPQHDVETMLEEQAQATHLVEIRRCHTVIGLQQQTDQALVEVESPAGTYLISASWAVACDGAQSHVRNWLEIKRNWQDYGTYSAVADLEMECDLPQTVSRIVLEPSRPYGFFYFAPGRWRMIYRINNNEDPHTMVQEEQVISLLTSYLPHAKIQRLLWASSFRLGQGQCMTYFQGRWILAGDAAHAMGPSAGAGMMIGLLGVWRLGWRLALLMHNPDNALPLLQDYTREQQAASRAVQISNALIFRNLSLANIPLASIRSLFLRIADSLAGVSQRIMNEETLVKQALPVQHATDIPTTGNWFTRQTLGEWRVGYRLPYLPLADQRTTLDLPKLQHLLIPIGAPMPHQEDELAQQIIDCASVPIERLSISAEVSAIWRVHATKHIAFALVRPDQHIAQIFTLH